MKERNISEKAIKQTRKAIFYTIKELSTEKYPFPISYFLKGKPPASSIRRIAQVVHDSLVNLKN